MEKYRAIPNGYMTVGELAKRMGTTVRTLQYYDKENLLKPSAESEGGRRLQQMQTVDFKRYAAIITNLQMKNEQYYLIKYLDDQMLEHCSSAFD